MKNTDLRVCGHPVQENEHDIVVLLFGAAYAGPNKGTPTLY